MANDIEYGRLKNLQETAFRTQQDAFQKMKEAGGNRSIIQKELNASWDVVSTARDRMNYSYQQNQQEWDHYKGQLDSLSAQIDEANRRGDEYHSMMEASFERANNTYKYGDKSMASVYSSEAKGYRSTRDSWNNKKSQLIAERRSLNKPNSSFQRDREHYYSLKRNHDTIQARYQTAKAIHESAKTEFESAKARHESAKSAASKRLEYLKFENTKRRKGDENLMSRAGIPYFYQKDCKIVKASDGTINFYFGGLGEKDGLWHGHYAMDRTGKMTYLRKPAESHGSDKFTENKGGMTIYDRRARSSSQPTEGKGHLNVRDGRYGTEGYGHSTQSYLDGYRLSRDTFDGGKSEDNIHWINQNYKKNNPNRKTPPSDAK